MNGGRIWLWVFNILPGFTPNNVQTRSIDITLEFIRNTESHLAPKPVESESLFSQDPQVIPIQSQVWEVLF